MRQVDLLNQFVHEALAAGRSRPDIEKALAAAGWSGAEVRAALSGYADVDFTPPVPRPRPYVSAREAFVFGLMFVALAMSTWHLTDLAFDLIDHAMPDPADDPYRRYRVDAMRWSISILVVFFPLFLVLNARARGQVRADPGRRRSAVRKIFGYVTLFLAATGLLGDAVAAIYALLKGDLTFQFLLKALVVAAIGGMVWFYFAADIGEDRDES